MVKTYKGNYSRYAVPAACAACGVDMGMIDFVMDADDGMWSRPGCPDTTDGMHVPEEGLPLVPVPSRDLMCAEGPLLADGSYFRDVTASTPARWHDVAVCVRERAHQDGRMHGTDDCPAERDPHRWEYVSAGSSRDQIGVIVRVDGCEHCGQSRVRTIDNRTGSIISTEIVAS